MPEDMGRKAKGQSAEPTPALHSCPDFDPWIAAATGGLCEEAQKAIRAEISAVVETAALHAVNEGLTTEKACNRAIAELGDPCAALKRFRRAYITKLEAETIKKLGKLTWWRLGWPFSFPAVYLVFSLMMNQGTAFLLLASVYTLLLIAAARIGRRLAACGRVQTAILLLFAAYSAVAVLLTLSMRFTVEQALVGSPHSEFVLYVLLALCFSFLPGLLDLLVSYLPLVVKLRRIQRIRPNES